MKDLAIENMSFTKSFVAVSLIEKLSPSWKDYKSNFKQKRKDLGETDAILGIKILRNYSGLILNQSHYVEKILRKFGPFDSSPVSTPYNFSIHLKKNVKVQ